MNLASGGFVYIHLYMIQLQVMHGGHLFSSYQGTSQNEATGTVVPRILSYALLDILGRCIVHHVAE